MRRIHRLLGVAVGLPTILAAQTPSTWTIDNVSVVDVAAGTVVAGQRVVVTGTRITASGPALSVTSPPNAILVDGRGKFLIPGLWDMHVHLEGLPNSGATLGLFLANGITGVRDMGAGVASLMDNRAAVASGRVLGPRIVGAGVLIDGEPIVYPGITRLATTPADVRKAVDSLASAGVDFIKAYEMLRPEVYFALAEQARAQNLTFVGHLPLMVSAEEALRAGHKSFEHLRGLDIACSSKADSLRAVAREMIAAGKDAQGSQVRGSIHAALRPRAYDTYDPARCGALIRQMAQAGVWQTPNLVLATQSMFRHDTTEFIQRWAKYIPPAMRSFLLRSATPMGPRGVRSVDWMMRLTKMLHDSGVRVLPGSDYPNAVMLPGPSMHEELALLVRAGLTPAEALRAGTLNPALYLGMADSLGTITTGKLADVVLLDANPLDDIRNVARVHAVWRGGRHLSRVALDLMLEGLSKPGGR
jgi:imidazolonepropionase-like amidohydrolase